MPKCLSLLQNKNSDAYFHKKGNPISYWRSSHLKKTRRHLERKRSLLKFFPRHLVKIRSHPLSIITHMPTKTNQTAPIPFGTKSSLAHYKLCLGFQEASICKSIILTSIEIIPPLRLSLQHAGKPCKNCGTTLLALIKFRHHMVGTINLNVCHILT